MIDDVVVTKKIFQRYSREFLDNTQVDVIIAGAGPAGLTAARILAEAGKKVLIVERKLAHALVGRGIEQFWWTISCQNEHRDIVH